MVIPNNRGPKQARVGILSDPTASTLEKAVLAGGIHENRNSLFIQDLVGIEKAVLSAIFDPADNRSTVTVVCVALPDAPKGVDAVLRLVFPSEVLPAGAAAIAANADVNTHTSKADDSTESVTTAAGIEADRMQATVAMTFQQGPRALARPVLEMVMSLGCAVIHICAHLSSQDKIVLAAQEQLRLMSEDKENTDQKLASTMKMHRTVCREACALLDPPLVGPPRGQAPRAVHPASLTPLAASLDTCTKILAMARNLLGSEGQALLLRDETTDPISYQVIHTGDVIHYPGVEQGSYGSASAGDVPSLAEAAMSAHRVILVDDATEDPRYCASLDGNVGAHTPMALVPVRGRGGAVVGCLIAVRGRNGKVFEEEDVTAAEIAVSHGALSLYWCQGLGALHHVLNKNIAKLQELETHVSTLRR